MSVYVGIDVHRKRSQVAVVTEDGQVQLNKNVVNGTEPFLRLIGDLPSGTRGHGFKQFGQRRRLARPVRLRQLRAGHAAHCAGARRVDRDRRPAIRAGATTALPICPLRISARVLAAMLRTILRGDPRRHEDLAALRVRAGTTNNYRRHPTHRISSPVSLGITPLVPPRLDRDEFGALLVTAGLPRMRIRGPRCGMTGPAAARTATLLASSPLMSRAPPGKPRGLGTLPPGGALGRQAAATAVIGHGPAVRYRHYVGQYWLSQTVQTALRPAACSS